MAETTRSWRGLLWAIGYAVVGVLIVGVLVVSTGGDVGVALQGWFVGAFGNGYSLVQTLSNATPLALVAMGAAIGAGVGLVVGAIARSLSGRRRARPREATTPDLKRWPRTWTAAASA